MNKRGMELSINTLVVVILGIVILGGGIAIIQGIAKEGIQIIRDVDAATEQRIDDLLAQGDLLAIPDTERTGRHETHTFVLGYVNRLPATHTFKPVVTPINLVNANGDISTDNLPAAFMPDYANGVVLLPEEQAPSVVFSIGITEGLQKGTYTYNVTILYDQETDGVMNDVYAGPRFVRINVI